MKRYTPTDEEINLAIDKLSGAFSGRYGFPSTEGALLITARGFARIVHFKSSLEMFGWPHETLGDFQSDADWLIEELVERTDKFPTLIAMRRLYETKLPARDGRSASEMGMPV